MANKSELIARMEDLLQQADVERAAEAVEGLKEQYEALVATAHQHSQEASPEAAPEAGQAEAAAPVEEVVTQPIESAPLQDEEDKKFKQLLDAFHTKVNDLHRQRQKEEADNLAAKTAIMDELKALVAGEENIGNAFQRFTELGEKWKTIGNVPQQNYRDLQRDYSHLRDEFFYHIRIYKELRDHDLKKNTALKQALIADMEAVQRVESVREAEQLVREYQEKWQQIGPVLKEEWEKVRDGFWNATRVVYDRINEHYRARRAEHEANLNAKQALVDKVNALVQGMENTGAKEWKALTDQVLELQTAWKSIGFATKKDNERIWKEFRTACNAFFDKKNAFYTELKGNFKAAFDKKQSLLQQAIQLKDSTDWRQTADKLKALQAQWKEAGSAGPRDENKLWNKFRESCDGFFQARKNFYDALDAEQAVHELAKEQLLSEIESFTGTGNRSTDIEMLKTFSQRWMNSGRVSPKKFDAMNIRYRAALDKHYGNMKLNEDERRRSHFQTRVEDLREGPDAKFMIEKEGRFIKRKIDELDSEVKMMERNMGMFNFKSASGEAMKKDMEKKIERTRQDITRLRQQLKQLNEPAKPARSADEPKPAPPAQEQAEATTSEAAPEAAAPEAPQS